MSCLGRVAARLGQERSRFLSLRLSSSTTTRTTSSVGLEKVLIANRGEIACRVIRTCRRLGIPTVAVYSSADGPNALHASMADEAYVIGSGPSAAESYLKGEEILRIAQDCGAQAIHPGYGFLSENATFCQLVKNSNYGNDSDSDNNSLIFIGPNPDTIQAMGSKSHSKDAMEKAAVPTTPGYHGTNQEPEYLLRQAIDVVGFPLLIKAVMGGGGKGMRLVWHADEFLEALESCQRESLSAFGDSSVLLEKYLVHPRHIEVQIMADTHGNTVHLYERDCSLQRRHQKVLEEAPANDLSEETRERLGQMGIRAAEAVGYTNAGTVEFLLDTQSENQDEFYFCEMNTRLQVEHPVTELVTGLDLVEWQLRIAAGEELPITDQNEIPCQGHALEARIYAENPLRDFLPTTGKVLHHNPANTPMNTGISELGVRVDSGIQKGSEIGVYYDPMISKLIVHGKDRDEARSKMLEALENYQIVGVPTNIEFVKKCVGHETFQEAGATNTGFLENHLERILSEMTETPLDSSSCAVAVFVAMLHREGRVGYEQDRLKSHHPWSKMSGSWRMGGPAGRRTQKLQIGDPPNSIEVECMSNRDGSFEVLVKPDNGDDAGAESFHIQGTLDDRGILDVVLNGSKRVSMQSFLHKNTEASSILFSAWPRDSTCPLLPVSIELQESSSLPESSNSKNNSNKSSAIQGRVHAPMPGKIVRIRVSDGDEVKAGDVLMVMEAMKMEHTISAPRDGIVTDLSCSLDQVVKDGAVLAVVAAAAVDDEEAASAHGTNKKTEA